MFHLIKKISIIFLFVGFLLSNIVIALASPTIIYTPNGTPVGADLSTVEQLTPAQIQNIITTINIEHPNATILGNPTSKYNCHSYAWHSQEIDNNIWINSPEQEKYWQDGSYYWIATSTFIPSGVLNNARVTYDGDDHSAIKNSDTHFISKWGAWALVKHEPFDCPDGYKAGGLQLSYYYMGSSYVKKVIITQGSNTYQAHWEWNVSQQKRELKIDKNDIFNSSPSLNFEIAFGKSMDTSFSGFKVELQNPNTSSWVPLPSGSWGTTGTFPNDKWTGSFTIPANENWGGDVKIKVTAKGMDGQDLDSNPISLAPDPGSDTLHHFTIDTTPPTISGVTIAPDPAFINPTLTAASTDTVSKIAEAEYYLDSADPGEGNGASLSAQDGTFDELTEDLTGTINISGLSNGQHTAHVRAKDAAGNWSQAISKTFTVGDNIPPVVTLIDFKTTDIKETRYYNCSDQYLYSIITPGSMRAAWKGRDNVTPPEKITFATMLEPVDAGYSGFGYSTSTVRSINEEGSYVFYLKAQDEADNESSPIGRAFTIGRQIINVKVGPGCDLNPDESYAIYTSPQNVEIQVDLDGDVAILGNGFVYEASQFLSQLKIPFNIRDPKALLTSKRYPVLFIPTAGLDGLENSPTFRNDLAQYVSEGGTIICMTQPHGYHFQALPGGSLTGVGYTEDISCWVSAFGQSHDHPIFYGLHPLTWIGSQDYMLDTYADGYFLKWSPETKVLATRLYNNMPGIVEYGYGQGKVIVTAGYMDWGSVNQQYSYSERTLMKNMIRYGLDKDKGIPLIAKGDALNTSITISFYDQQQARTASTVKYICQDGEENTIAIQEITLDIPLPEGGQSTLPVSIQTNADIADGLGLISYELYDAAGVMVQSEKKEHSFGVGKYLNSNITALPQLKSVPPG